LTRLLVVSDSHGKVDYIYDVIRKHQGDFDVFVHLGDKSYDMLSFLNDVSSLIMVKGNMETVFPDMNMEVEWERIVEYEGVKILATHGHRYSVHSTMVFLKKHALHLGINLVLFGHTHEQTVVNEDGIVYFNPGALQNRYYGMVRLHNGGVEAVEHCYLPERW